MDSSGIIFDIQGFSVHDGPGCRTLIFFKGCPLNCQWCSNPEGIQPYSEPLFFHAHCIRDGLCVSACDQHALRLTEQGLDVDRSCCALCASPQCAGACLTGGIKIAGTRITAEALYQKISRDRNYWGAGGGVTLTGGEPLAQVDFAEALLEKCYRAFIHTAAETCGNVPFRNFEKVLPYLDWIFFDLKHLDTEMHRKGTGNGNEKILDNLKKLRNAFSGKVIIRFPLIPDFNDSEAHLNLLAAFMRDHGFEELNILPVHHLGREKYSSLGREYPLKNLPHCTAEKLDRICTFFKEKQIRCYPGSSTPF